MGYAYIYIYIYIHHIFIHSSVDEYLHCFHALTIVNSAAVKTGVHVSFRIMVFPGYVPCSGIAGSYGRFIPSLFFCFNESPYCSP